MVETVNHDVGGAFIRVGSVEELKAKGMMVVRGGGCPLL